MLSRARKRRYAARSVTCVIAAMVAAPAAMAATTSVPPVAPSLPAGSIPGAVAAPLSTVSRGCRGAGARRARGAALRRAVLCLINQQRAIDGLNRLRANRRLARAAKRHAVDMARHNYFSHVSLSGSSPLRRVRAAGWRRGVGEALAWACGVQSTPRGVVAAWMASPSHRAIIMGRGHAVGLGYKRAPGAAAAVRSGWPRSASLLRGFPGEAAHGEREPGGGPDGEDEHGRPGGGRRPRRGPSPPTGRRSGA